MSDSLASNDLFKSVLIKDNEQAHVVTGPLSEKCTEVLNELYKIKIDENTGIAIETQAIDQTLGRSAWIASSLPRLEIANTGANVGLVYGVDQQTAGISTTVDISESLNEMSESEKENSVIVFDQNSDQNPFSQTIKTIASNQGVPVVYGMEEYTEFLRSKLKSKRRIT